MSVPRATYRVQLHRDFGFDEAAALVPYLAALGISTLYCAPILQARIGSTHGYDTTNPARLSEELGGEKGWTRLCACARRHGLSILLDIVPNHMAASVENPWWRDVLEHGRVSPYADVFDIDWESPSPRLRNRVMLPLLPAPLNDVIASRQMSVHLTPSGLVLKYGQLELPLDIHSYRHILSPLLDMPADALSNEFIRLVRSIAALHSVREMPVSRPDVVYALRVTIKQRLLDLMLSPKGTSDAGEGDIAGLVRAAASGLSPGGFRHMLQEQHYVLEYWKSGRNHVNYRRFFDINDLVGVRVEDDQVFEVTHGLLRVLAASGPVCGFRVDHIDGLRQPLRYLAQLRSTCVTVSQDFTPHTPYVVVEKILTGDEVLPPDWPVDGTTGYEFLNEVNGLFVDPAGLASLQRHYRQTTRTRKVRAKLTSVNKRKALAQLFRADLSRLAHILMPAARWLYPGYDLSATQMVNALINVTAALPVYRTYYRGAGGLTDADRRCIDAALTRTASRSRRNTDAVAYEVVERALRLDIPKNAPAHVHRAVREHLLRWQQLTGAAMAKGFEDTTLYQDTVLLSLNDVGSRPDHEATTIADFHRWNQIRLRDWPATLNCTATHDTKRGEDVRARLNVLSEMPEDWLALADRWLDLTASVCPGVDAATALLLLQTLVGTWPGGDPGEVQGFSERVKQYLVKAAREAKTHSNWLEPNIAYEDALQRLADTVLGDSVHRDMRDEIEHVARTIAFHGSVNSLAQTVLKAMCPGIPDFYQGTELWELSMVDPDNRRPVDYSRRSRLLEDLASAIREDRLVLADELAARWPDPRAKLLATHVVLRLRRENPTLFEKGDYVPLEADGKARGHIVAFARSLRDSCVLVVAPVQSRALSGAG